jgi:hypothetical protein
MRASGLDWIPLEYFIGNKSYSCFTRCPKGWRLLELLNDSNATYLEAFSFSELIQAYQAGSSDSFENKADEYYKKTCIDLITVDEANIARGIGRRLGPKYYPYREKQPITISVQLPHHTLLGLVHCLKGEEIDSYLDSYSMFFPLTDVTITDECGCYDTRPFAAVNKEHILSLRKENSCNTNRN